MHGALGRSALVIGSWLVGPALVLVASACTGARGGSVVAPVDITVAPVGSVAPLAIINKADQSGGTCELQLVASRIEKSASGCYLDEHISEGPGVLRYACSGDGDAEADFGKDHYVGRIVGGNVHLERSTELDWEDGCRWGTQAAIRGTVVLSHEPVLRKLAWNYHDRVISGEDCSGVCTAKTSIEVKSKGRRDAEDRSNDDDEAVGD